MGAVLDTFVLTKMCAICTQCKCLRHRSGPHQWIRCFSREPHGSENMHDQNSSQTKYGAAREEINLMTFYKMNNGTTTTTTVINKQVTSAKHNDSRSNGTKNSSRPAICEEVPNDSRASHVSPYRHPSRQLSEAESIVEESPKLAHLSPKQVADLHNSWKTIRPKMKDIGLTMFIG